MRTDWGITARCCSTRCSTPTRGERSATSVPADGTIELGIETGPGLEALHDLHWELMHDGSGYVSLQASPAVCVVRIAHGPAPTTPQTLTREPRLLFAVGTTLNDVSIQPGAEFMGILRRLEIRDGRVHPKVVVEATRTKLRDALAEFRPDIVHVVAHGEFVNASQSAVLHLRPETAGAPTDRVSADDLAKTLGVANRPMVVVLSACDTAVGGTEGTPSMATALVGSGIPIVIAMGGAVADKACRMFSRAIVGGVAGKGALTTVVASGRRAAFTDSSGVASIDWALPQLHVSGDVPVGFRVVDRTATEETQRVLACFDLGRNPVFCGRTNFLELLEEVVDPTSGLRALGAIVTGRPQGNGSERLLRELALRALRAGEVPLFLHFTTSDDDRPVDAVSFGNAVRRLIARLRSDVLGQASPVDLFPDGYPPEQIAADVSAEALAFAADLAGTAPFGATPRPLLLMSQIHLWDRACDFVLSRIVTSSFTAKVPVVYSGAATHETGQRVKQAWEAHREDEGVGWLELLPLDRWAPDEEEVIYPWLLLNPIKFDGVRPPAYTRLPGAGTVWRPSCSNRMQAHPLFDRDLYRWAEDTGSAANWFRPNDDETALANFAELAE